MRVVLPSCCNRQFMQRDCHIAHVCPLQLMPHQHFAASSCFAVASTHAARKTGTMRPRCALRMISCRAKAASGMVCDPHAVDWNNAGFHRALTAWTGQFQGLIAPGAGAKTQPFGLQLQRNSSIMHAHELYRAYLRHVESTSGHGCKIGFGACASSIDRGRTYRMRKLCINGFSHTGGIILRSGIIGSSSRLHRCRCVSSTATICTDPTV